MDRGVGYKSKGNCRLCNTQLGQPVFSLPPTPLANSFTKTKEEALVLPRFPLSVFACSACGHHQLGIVVDPSAMFSEYNYASGTAKSFREHFASYAKEIVQRYMLNPQSARLERDMPPFRVLEVGSNDGTMLKALLGSGATSAVGVEPAQNLAKACLAEGLTVVPEFFSERVAHYGPVHNVDFWVANNVLAHVDDFVGTLGALAMTNAKAGVFEVQYLGALLDGGMFDMCLPPGQSIITECGLRPIEQVKVGDKVLTHAGYFRTVTKTFERNYVGPMYSFDVYGHSDPLRVTHGHPLWSRERYNHDKWLRLPEFTPSEKVKKGDAITSPHVMENTGAPDKLTIECATPGRGGKKTFAFPVNGFLCKLIGFFAAEGWLNVNKGQKKYQVAEFAFGKSKKEKLLAEECAEAARELGTTGTVRWTRFGWHVNVYGPLAQLLSREVGQGAANKAFPSWAFKLPLPMAKMMLWAYVRGDGYVYRKTMWRASTVSRELAHGCALLAAKFGWATSLHRTEAKTTAVRIAGNSRDTTYRQPLWDVLIKLEQKKNIKTWSTSEGIHRTVQHVTSVQYAGKVHNIEVEGDHSYVTPQGAVHNCYHEHLDYWRATELVEQLHKHTPWAVVDVEIVPTHGGSLRVWVERPTKDWFGVMPRALELVVAEAQRDWAVNWAALNENMKFERERLRARLLGRRAVIFGAPAKLTSLLYGLGLTDLDFAYVVDDSPLKQSLFTPGMGLEVVGVDQLVRHVNESEVDTVLIGAWNFAKHIKPRLTAMGVTNIVTPFEK